MLTFVDLRTCVAFIETFWERVRCAQRWHFELDLDWRRLENTFKKITLIEELLVYERLPEIMYEELLSSSKNTTRMFH